MPFAAVLTAAARDAHTYTPPMHPGGEGGRVARRHGHVESAIAIKQRRVVTIEFQAFLVANEH